MIATLGAIIGFVLAWSKLGIGGGIAFLLVLLVAFPALMYCLDSQV